MKTKLNTTQIKHISRLIEMKGVNYYDVNMELTDHMACEVETLIEEAGLEYMQAVKQVFLRYDRFHFMRIEDKKVKELRKKGRRAILKGLIDYFSIPKIILTIGIFLFTTFILNTIGFSILFYSIFLLMLIITIKLVIYKKKHIKSKPFLQLQMFGGGFTIFLIQISFQTFFSSESTFETILEPVTKGLYIKAFVFTIFILLNLINYELYTTQLNKLKQAYA